MKKRLLTLLCTVAALGASAKVITVSNNANSPGQYTNLQAACDAASAGDTIYVHASATSYGDVNIIKKLTLIGTSKSNEAITMLGKIDISFKTNSTTESGSGSVIKGFNAGVVYLNTISPGSGAISVSGILIERNVLSGIIFNAPNSSNGFAGCVIRHNIVWNTSISASGFVKNVQITNNIANISFNNSSDCIVANNLIGNLFADNCMIANNIVAYSGSSQVFNGKGNTIKNNLFYKSWDASWSVANLDPARNIIGENLFADPKFINPPKDLFYGVAFPLAATKPNNYNLNVEEGSPCKGAGTDGKDIGIYGGSTPWPESGFEDVGTRSLRYAPVPNIPVMLEMGILNTSVLPNGTLNVEFKARKQD